MTSFKVSEGHKEDSGAFTQSRIRRGKRAVGEGFEVLRSQPRPLSNSAMTESGGVGEDSVQTDGDGEVAVGSGLAANSYAALILKELNQPCHRLLEGLPTYDHAIFRRYSSFLWRDVLRTLRHRLGPASLRGCASFTVLYLILTTPWGFRLLGKRTRGLHMLIRALAPAVGLPRFD